MKLSDLEKEFAEELLVCGYRMTPDLLRAALRTYLRARVAKLRRLAALSEVGEKKRLRTKREQSRRYRSPDYEPDRVLTQLKGREVAPGLRDVSPEVFEPTTRRSGAEPETWVVSPDPLGCSPREPSRLDLLREAGARAAERKRRVDKLRR